MKTLLSYALTLLLMVSYAQETRFEKAMLNALEKMNQASTIGEFTEAANIFERIANAETGEWIPLYHAAHAWLIIGFTEQDADIKEPCFDKAQQLLDRALLIAPEESELYTLQAFIYPGKISINPIVRGPGLIGKMNQAIDKAISLNPDNPRSYYLRAVTLANMPEAFGGGREVAKPIFETARQKFVNFTPNSPLWPNWGKELNEEELSKL